MSTEASPRPWLCMCGSDVNAVFAANGALVARVEKSEDAALIVDAVNGIEETKRLSIKLYDPIRRAEAERDRLRGLVRRLVDALAPIVGVFESHIACCDENKWKGGIDQIWSGHDPRALLREARAAIGEEKP